MIELQTLGETDLWIDGQPAKSLVAHQKRLALLVYLIVADVTVHRRDTLLALFWPELDTSRARCALRKALHFIRRDIGDDVLVNRGDESIAVDRSRVRCDATALQVAAAAADDVVVSRLNRGEFLPGFHLDDAPAFDAWVENTRRKVSDVALGSALRYANRLESAGQFDEASDAMRGAQRMAPYDPRVLRETVDLLTRAGQRFRAIRVYDELAERLLGELGDCDAAIAAYEEALRMRESLETDIRLERLTLRDRLTALRQHALSA